VSGARQINRQYRDPVDQIWLATARKLGLEVRRTRAAYASYDGQGVLSVAEPVDFDADDSLAQMILHELCHALVAGPDAMSRADWGMCNHDDRDLVHEHACQRLQAALSDRHGLRGLMAVTTDHRAYWDGLPREPLLEGQDGDAIEIARAGWQRARAGRWGEALERALSATAVIARVVKPFCEDDSLWNEARALHASGFAQSDDPAKACGNCAWTFSGGPGRPLLRCRQTRRGPSAPGVRVNATDRACVRWEASFDASECASCGACCRHGFDLVPVRPRDPIRRMHPELVRADAHGLHVPRPGGRCLALVGEGDANAPYRCRVYSDRPRACAEFEVRGDACLEARRRVGLSS
jgi:hypothetical protein